MFMDHPRKLKKERAMSNINPHMSVCFFLQISSDHAHQPQRFAESLQKPLRTYRMEFNLGRPDNNNGSADLGTLADGSFHEVTEDVYTSTYTATQ